MHSQHSGEGVHTYWDLSHIVKVKESYTNVMSKIPSHKNTRPQTVYSSSLQIMLRWYLYAIVNIRTTDSEHYRTTDSEHYRTTDSEHYRTTDSEHYHTTDSEHYHTTDSEHYRTTDSEHYRTTDSEHYRTTDSEHYRPLTVYRTTDSEHYRTTDSEHYHWHWMVCWLCGMKSRS